MPSSPGMRMSISSTSGLRRAAARPPRGRPPPRPTTLDVVLGVEQRGEPGPDQRLVVGERDPDHGGHLAPVTGSQRPRRRNPPSGRGPASNVPPSAARPLGHPGDAVARSAAPPAPARRRQPHRPCRRRPPRPASVAVSVAELHARRAGRRSAGRCWSAPPARSGTPRQVDFGGQRPRRRPSTRHRASPAVRARAARSSRRARPGAGARGACSRVAQHAEHRARARSAPARSPR